jgi:hypothetical protein
VYLWTIAGASAALAAVASLADWKRQRRRDPDRVGFMPWALVTMLGIFAAFCFAALALKIG